MPRFIFYYYSNSGDHDLKEGVLPILFEKKKLSIKGTLIFVSAA